MEAPILKIKKEVSFDSGRGYSVCMRGARSWDKSKKLSIYTNGDGDLINTPIEVSPHCQATIISQAHFRFSDLPEEDTRDNYDKDARSIEGLFKAMRNVYGQFHPNEIVTVLRFEIDKNN